MPSLYALYSGLPLLYLCLTVLPVFPMSFWPILYPMKGALVFRLGVALFHVTAWLIDHPPPPPPSPVVICRRRKNAAAEWVPLFGYTRSGSA